MNKNDFTLQSGCYALVFRNNWQALSYPEYFLDDLLLVVEAGLQVLHIELEQVQGRRACRHRGSWDYS